MLPLADLILMGIQAGVRLYSGFREAYVASIKEAAITLPLPRAPEGCRADPVHPVRRPRYAAN